MARPDGRAQHKTEHPMPPKYEKIEEIQEFDASGQLVTTLTVQRGTLHKGSGYSYADSSLPDDFLARYPESLVDISVSCVQLRSI